MSFAAFDLEIARILPRDADDLLAFRPLGITCAALAFSDGRPVELFSATPQLTREEAIPLVHRLQAVAASGSTLVTWNGCGFDFPVLADESGLVQECAELALAHVDLMLLVTFRKGWRLSLA